MYIDDILAASSDQIKLTPFIQGILWAGLYDSGPTVFF